jgi:hypothetical protein
MAIYRGAGGAGDAVADSSSEALLVRALATQVSADAVSSAASASAASGSASSASTSATNAANSAAAVTNASNLTSGTLAAARLPAFTGDSTSTVGTSVLTLATVNSNTGAFGSATSIPVVTVNAKGLVTAVTTATVQGGQYFGAAASKAIAYNETSIAENITTTTGKNCLSVGPITISSGNTVTIASGQRWLIL